MFTSPTSPTFTELIQPELEPEERVTWVGRPDAIREARQSAPISFVGVIWTAASLNGLLRNLDRGWLDNLFIGAFVAVGVALGFYPLLAYWVSLRTVYAITDRRLLVATPAWPKTVQSYCPSDLSEITRTDLADGRGDLTFARQRVKNSAGPEQYRDVKLVGVLDVRQVESMLRALKAG